MKLPGFERKLRVAIDWTLDLFFPRDIVYLRPLHAARGPSAVAHEPEAGEEARPVELHRPERPAGRHRRMRDEELSGGAIIRLALMFATDKKSLADAPPGATRRAGALVPVSKSGYSTDFGSPTASSRKISR